jgi:hypothetical protein
MKITKQDLVELIKEELDTMLSEQPRPGSLGARAAQRSRDRTSQGLGQTPTEKRVQAKTTGAGWPSGQSAAEQERRVRGGRDQSGIRTGGAGMDSAALKKPMSTRDRQLKSLRTQGTIKPAADVNVGARTRPGASTQTAGEQERRVAGAADTSGIRTGGGQSGTEAFAQMKATPAPKSRRAKSKDAYYKTLSRMSDRGTIKQWQQDKLDAYKASQAPSTPTMGQATGMSFLDTPGAPAKAGLAAASGESEGPDPEIKAQDDVLRNLTAQGALGEHLETIVNEILSRLNQ